MFICGVSDDGILGCQRTFGANVLENETETAIGPKRCVTSQKTAAEETTYTSTEEVVFKLAEALNVDINPNDVEISHKLHRKGIKPIIVKFQSHKVKSRMYKERAKLKHVRVADLYPGSTAATRVESERIYLNENLTSYRRDILKQANQKRKDGLLTSAWSMDGKIFVKTSPEGRPIRIYDKTDLENL